MTTQTPSIDTTTLHAHLDDTVTPPRTRWAAIIWGTLFAVIAATSLWLVADDERRAGIADGVLALTPATISTLVILTIGVLLLVTGAAGLIRRMQHRRAAGAVPGPTGDIPAK